jgi:uncharacterized protein with GYD domain
MKPYALIVSALAIGLSLPAMAQQSMHRYVAFFKYSDTAVKSMTETPQDRAAQAAELAESFGGKMEAAYWFPAGSEYDGMVIWTFPDNVSEEAQSLFVRATGNFTRIKSLSLMTGEEFKAAMEKAKNVKTVTLRQHQPSNNAV